MKGYHFFAVMPDDRKSKSASKQYPMQPWTRATLETYAAQKRYVECLAVAPETKQGSNMHNAVMYDCIGALAADNDQAVCGATCHNTYLRDRCTRISEDLARKLHPALFRYLEG
jgi:hypothetical protein